MRPLRPTTDVVGYRVIRRLCGVLVAVILTGCLPLPEVPTPPGDLVETGGIGVSEGIGLVARLTFDQNIDASSTVSLVGTEWVPGVSLDALAFTGAGSYARLDNHPNTDLPEQGSLVAWVRPDPHTNNAEIIRKGDGASADWLLQFWQAQGQLALFLIKDSGPWGELYSNLWLPEGIWAHVTATWDQLEMRLYINGVLDASAPNPISPVQSTGNVILFGNIPGDPSDGFVGAVDDLQIYDRALTPTEVERVYRTGWPQE